MARPEALSQREAVELYSEVELVRGIAADVIGVPVSSIPEIEIWTGETKKRLELEGYDTSEPMKYWMQISQSSLGRYVEKAIITEDSLLYEARNFDRGGDDRDKALALAMAFLVAGVCLEYARYDLRTKFHVEWEILEIYLEKRNDFEDWKLGD